MELLVQGQSGGGDMKANRSIDGFCVSEKRLYGCSTIM